MLWAGKGLYGWQSNNAPDGDTGFSDQHFVVESVVADRRVGQSIWDTELLSHMPY